MYKMDQKDNFTITKKIAKHGNQAIIVVPRILEERLRPGTIVRLEIDVLEEAKEKIKITGEEK
jgi:hypothetical protein